MRMQALLARAEAILQNARDFSASSAASGTPTLSGHLDIRTHTSASGAGGAQLFYAAPPPVTIGNGKCGRHTVPQYLQCDLQPVRSRPPTNRKPSLLHQRAPASPRSSRKRHVPGYSTTSCASSRSRTTPRRHSAMSYLGSSLHIQPHMSPHTRFCASPRFRATDACQRVDRWLACRVPLRCRGSRQP